MNEQEEESNKADPEAGSPSAPLLERRFLAELGFTEVDLQEALVQEVLRTLVVRLQDFSNFPAGRTFKEDDRRAFAQSVLELLAQCLPLLEGSDYALRQSSVAVEKTLELVEGLVLWSCRHWPEALLLPLPTTKGENGSASKNFFHTLRKPTAIRLSRSGGGIHKAKPLYHYFSQECRHALWSTFHQLFLSEVVYEVVEWLCKAEEDPQKAGLKTPEKDLVEEVKAVASADELLFREAMRVWGIILARSGNQRLATFMLDVVHHRRLHRSHLV
ncbi:hypothetical protein QOT17_008151 [Balamuthia mandrillaris]